MALQHDMGLLSKHRTLHHFFEHHRSARDRPNLESRLIRSIPTYCSYFSHGMSIIEYVRKHEQYDKETSIMTQADISLAALRSESQKLHHNIAGLFSEGLANAKADLEKFQAEARKLGENLKLRAKIEQGAIKARMHEAGVKLEAERLKVNDNVAASVEATQKKMEGAKVKLLRDITAATRSLSEAIAARRNSVATSTSTTKMV